MNIWFKQALIYRLTRPLETLDNAALQQMLQVEQFTPCTQSEQSKIGWVSPYLTEQLFAQNEQNLLFIAQKEEKILPAHVVKNALDQRVAEIEKKTARKVSKLDKQNLKDDVIATLLPRAFSKNQHTILWLDQKNDLLYVNTTSRKRAEETLGLLRKTLGSLPVVPLAFKEDCTEIMRSWLLNDETPLWLEVLADAELKDDSDGAVIRCKKQDLHAEEVRSFLASGKRVVKLSLDWAEHLSFTLQEDASLARIKYADDVLEENADIDKADHAQRLDADFILMTAQLQTLTQNLGDCFGGFAEK